MYALQTVGSTTSSVKGNGNADVNIIIITIEYLYRTRIISMRIIFIYMSDINRDNIVRWSRGIRFILYDDIFLSCVDDTEVLELDDVGNSIVEQIISNSNAVKRSGNLTASTWSGIKYYIFWTHRWATVFISVECLLHVFYLIDMPYAATWVVTAYFSPFIKHLKRNLIIYSVIIWVIVYLCLYIRNFNTVSITPFCFVIYQHLCYNNQNTIYRVQ